MFARGDSGCLGPELALDKVHMVFLQVMMMLSRRLPFWDDAERALGAVPQPRRMPSLTSPRPSLYTVIDFLL